MEVSHVMRRKKNDVVVRRIEMTEGAVYDVGFRQSSAAFCLKVAYDELVLLAFIRGSLWNE